MMYKIIVKSSIYEILKDGKYHCNCSINNKLENIKKMFDTDDVEYEDN